MAERLDLFGITHGQRWRYTGAILAQGIATVLLFGVPLASMIVIDRMLDADRAQQRPVASWMERTAEALILRPDRTETLWNAGLWVLVFTVCAALFAYLRARWAATASESIVRRLRDRLFDHLERLPAAWHDRAETGDLVQRCSSDVETLRLFYSAQVVEIGRALILFLLVVPILHALDPRMTVAALSLFPFIVGFALFFFRRVREQFKAMDEAEGRLTSGLQENLTGIRVVRAFARQDHEREKFGAKNIDFRDHNLSLVRTLGTYWAASDLMCFTQIGIVVTYGALRVMAGDLTIGTFFAAFSYVWTVIWPVRHMGRVLTDAGKAVVASQRIRQVLEVPQETAGDGRTLEPLHGLAGAISVAGLSHTFDRLAGTGDGPGNGRADVLNDISFEIRPGETLALLGPPGSGKSTIVNLLCRLYDYERGSIQLDGRELSSLSRRYVRSQIACVLQEPFLYAKTISENLMVGRSGVPNRILSAATTDACVHDSITEFEDGYETLLGERGITLSGGQRQRVAIARALLKDAPILVLDDALSAVDTQTEAHILDALARRRGTKTTILIAHRLSSILHADKILVLEGGRIVQSGRHETLVREEGPYQRLWRIQGALEEALSEDLAHATHGGGT